MKQAELKNKYSKYFNLSESYGPNHKGLEIIKVKEGQDTDWIILKEREFVMFPPKSYGATHYQYTVYYFDKANNRNDVIFMFRFDTKKQLDQYFNATFNGDKMIK